jgi:hypothetical protein
MQESAYIDEVLGRVSLVQVAGPFCLCDVLASIARRVTAKTPAVVIIDGFGDLLQQTEHSSSRHSHGAHSDRKLLRAQWLHHDAPIHPHLSPGQCRLHEEGLGKSVDQLSTSTVVVRCVHTGAACAFAVARYVKTFARKTGTAVVVTSHSAGRTSNVPWTEQPHCQLMLEVKEDAETFCTVSLTQSSIPQLACLESSACTCEMTAQGLCAHEKNGL